MRQNDRYRIILFNDQQLFCYMGKLFPECLESYGIGLSMGRFFLYDFCMRSKEKRCNG